MYVIEQVWPRWCETGEEALAVSPSEAAAVEFVLERHLDRGSFHDIYREGGFLYLGWVGVVRPDGQAATDTWFRIRPIPVDSSQSQCERGTAILYALQPPK